MRTDAEIKQDILDELAWLPDIDETRLGVMVEDGVVTLTGVTNKYYEKTIAEKAVKNIAGVKAVAEDIEVKYGDDFKKTDKEIAKAALNALEWNASVPTDQIMLKVEDGHIYLSGKVPWAHQRKAAKRTIAHLLGVKGVHNAIQLEQKIKPMEVKDHITKAFERTAHLDAHKIHITADGHTVKLSGTVYSIREKEDAEKAAYRAPGVQKVINQIVVAHIPHSIPEVK